MSGLVANELSTLIMDRKRNYGERGSIFLFIGDKRWTYAASLSTIYFTHSDELFTLLTSKSRTRNDKEIIGTDRNNFLFITFTSPILCYLKLVHPTAYKRKMIYDVYALASDGIDSVH